MRIDIRLQKVLQEAGLDSRGITQRIADDLGLHRHTIGKLYRNQISNPSLRVLEQVCEWLKAHGVDAPLPAALFGVRPSALWQALAGLNRVTFYLGEYVEFAPGEPGRRWVATCDVEAWARIVSTLTGEGEIGRTQLALQYVRFRYGAAGRADGQQVLLEDERNAVEAFNRLRRQPHCAILIGSQRVNYLLEPFVADLFGAEPFKAIEPREDPVVPFYLLTAQRTPAAPSCFGGPIAPAGWQREERNALLWRDDQGRWHGIPWVRDKQEGALILTVYYPGTQAVHVALFGYSGQGTRLAAEKLSTDPHLFWPPPAEIAGRQVGVYVLCFETGKERRGKSDGRVMDRICKVIPLGACLLKEGLRAG